LNPVFDFPETSEMPVYLMGFADDVGEVSYFKVIKNDLTTLIHRRRFIRSSAYTNQISKKVSFIFNAQEILRKLDTIPEITSNNRHLTSKYRNVYDDVSNRTCSKISQIDGISVNNRFNAKSKRYLSVDGLLFPLHDIIL
jgi:subtilase family serine protease